MRHPNTKHGLRGTPEYRAWAAMKSRCSDPNVRTFALYGGRGIRVCPRWQHFELFIADMGPRPSAEHSIDRIDNNKGYEPGNCRWATRADQSRNRRSNRIITYAGLQLPLAEWAERRGMSPRTLIARLRKGWTVEAAIETAVRPKRTVSGKVVPRG